MLQAIIEVILEFLWEWVLAGRYWRIVLSLVLVAVTCLLLSLWVSNQAVRWALMSAFLLVGVAGGVLWQVHSG